MVNLTLGTQNYLVDVDSLNIHIGPEALIFSSQEQRNEIYDLYKLGKGIRAWSSSASWKMVILFELGNGAKGKITRDGEVVWS